MLFARTRAKCAKTAECKKRSDKRDGKARWESDAREHTDTHLRKGSCGRERFAITRCAQCGENDKREKRGNGDDDDDEKKPREALKMRVPQRERMRSRGFVNASLTTVLRFIHSSTALAHRPPPSSLSSNDTWGRRRLPFTHTLIHTYTHTAYIEGYLARTRRELRVCL